MSEGRYTPTPRLVLTARMAEYLADTLGGSEQEWWWIVRRYRSFDEMFADIDYLRTLAVSDNDDV